MTVSAEDRQGAEGWRVRFDGKAMETNFTSGNMADEVNLMQPGDSVELTIILKNDYDGQADWYMKNEVLNSLEDAGDAAGGAYDYLLTYTDTAGETTTLYSSEKFGGEGRINGVGLHGATTTLDDYFYLDRMGNGDEGVVKLKVALDGETLVNDYQNTFARLQMDFATEALGTWPGTPDNPGGNPSGNPGNPGNPGTPGEGDPPGDVVKTGDQETFMASMIGMLAAGLAIMVIVVVRLRRERGDAYEDEGAAGRVDANVNGGVARSTGAGMNRSAARREDAGVSEGAGRNPGPRVRKRGRK
jgi:hypothetical protein